MLTPTVSVQQPNAVDAVPVATGRRAYLVALLIAAGVALHTPGLTWGFLIDDNLHQYVLRGLAQRGNDPRRDLYDFGPRGSLADAANEWHFQVWWADPAFNVRFFRPVTSLSLRLDYRLYRDWAPGYHLTSLVLFAAFLILVHRLYLRLDLPPKAALWALAAVALSQAHTLPVGWIANRNTLLAALFTVATILNSLTWRRTLRPIWAGLAAICFLLACGSKESGIAAIPLAVLAMNRSKYRGEPRALTRADSSEPPLGITSVLPSKPESPAVPPGGQPRRAAPARLPSDPLVRSLAALAALWLTLYLASGCGAHSDLYPAPWTDPVGYLLRLALLLPAGLGALFFCVPLDVVAAGHSKSAIWIACMLLAAFVLSARVFLRFVPHRPLAGLGLGWVVVCLIAEAGGEISDRLLMGASIGAGLLIGPFFDAAGAPWTRRGRRDRPVLALSVALFGANFVAAVPVNLFRGHVFAASAAQNRQLLLDAEIDRSAPPHREAFLLNMPSALMLIDCGPTWGMHYKDRDTWFYPLQAGRRGLLWTRTGERTMTLTVRGAPLLDHRLERLFRYRRLPQLGDAFRTQAFRANALAVDGNGIRTLLLEFEKPLDDPSYFFLRYLDGRLRRVTPPSSGQAFDFPEIIPPNAFIP